jgi:hypothetical protein
MLKYYIRRIYTMGKQKTFTKEVHTFEVCIKNATTGAVIEKYTTFNRPTRVNICKAYMQKTKYADTNFIPEITELVSKIEMSLQDFLDMGKVVESYLLDEQGKKISGNEIPNDKGNLTLDEMFEDANK